ncbi:MAG TPA: MBL fold metallo-hydrolase [Nitrolancea sp.]|jgi:glyoxylase-like metal-dependent hydrolase (beta-lactamase superfamily II)|nr:MBL fold metallo-hydrolase [Nitrolancea sp.]
MTDTQQRDGVCQEAADRLIRALGGRDAIERAAVQRTRATGSRRHPGWGPTPGEPELVAEFLFDLVEDLSAARYRLQLSGPTHLVPVNLGYREIGDGLAGHVAGVDFMFDPSPVDMPIPSWRVAARQRHIDLTSPLRMARKMLRGDVEVRCGETAEDLILEEPGRPALHLQLMDTGLLASVRLTENHAPHGDVPVEIRFSRYGRVGEYSLPYRMEILVNDTLVHDEIRFRIEVHSEVDDAEFGGAGPQGSPPTDEQARYALWSTEWLMTYVLSGVRFYFDLQSAPALPEPAAVGEGVKVVIGPSHNIMVVEMPDYIVAVDAPLYARYTAAALEQVRSAFPGKPLRYVVATHFHYDHIGGIREFAAEGGVTILCADNTVPFFEAILRSDHTISPDRLQQNPVQVDVQGVNERFVLPTAHGGQLEVHRIETDHSKDTLIVYVSGANAVFESDLWSATPVSPEPFSYRGRLAAQLCQAIEERGLNVDTIVSGHRGTDGKTWSYMAPYAYLRRAAGLAS